MTTAAKASTNALIRPDRLWSRDDVLARDVVPRSRGVYAWWFRDIPPGVPTKGCVQCDGRTLLYIGIAPKAPPAGGSPGSVQTLRHRIRCHMCRDAEGSTLRLTLGCLLREQLGIELRRVGRGTRMTFAIGEEKLSEWMSANAFVCWMVTERPWELETTALTSVCLPLNLAQNQSHRFHRSLSEIRAEAKRRARALPVLSRSGGLVV